MAGWIKQWEVPDDHWLRSDLRYMGAWLDLLQMAETKNKKIVRNGKMFDAERGNVYTSLHELAEKWHVTRRFVRHFIDMLVQDDMVSVLLADHRGYHLKVNNYAKYQDKPDYKRTTKDTTKDTTNSTTEDTTEDTTKASFFLINNTEGIEGIEGESRTKRFTPPTIEEIRAYIFQKDLKIDAERFFDYYQANGWKVGKNAMRDWKAACRSWASRDKAESSRRTDPNPKRFDNFKQRDNYDDLVRKIEEERYGA